MSRCASVRRAVCAVAFFLPWLSCSLFVPVPAPAPRVAVVYGVSLYDTAYTEGVGNNLTYANDDAVAVAGMLESAGYLVTLRTDDAATRANLASDLEAAALSAGADGTVLFYFSGHGAQGNVSPTLTVAGAEPPYRDQYDEWIFLYGSLAIDHVADADLALSDDELGALLSALPPSRRVVVIDACNSGGFVGAAASVDADAAGTPGPLGAALSLYLRPLDSVNTDVAASAALVMAAAQEQEVTYESGEVSHGIFTRYLLDARRLGDHNGDGLVTLTEAYAYIRSEVSARWPDTGPHPMITGSAIDLVLFPSEP